MLPKYNKNTTLSVVPHYNKNTTLSMVPHCNTNTTLSMVPPCNTNTTLSMVLHCHKNKSIIMFGIFGEGYILMLLTCLNLCYKNTILSMLPHYKENTPSSWLVQLRHLWSGPQSSTKKQQHTHRSFHKVCRLGRCASTNLRRSDLWMLSKQMGHFRQVLSSRSM